MKLSLLALAAILTPSLAFDFTLRGANKEENAKYQARFFVKGLNNEASKQDLDIIAESIVHSYNKAYGEKGHSLDAFQLKKALTMDLSSPSGWWGCRYCLDDDATEEKGTMQMFFADVSPSSSGWWGCRYCLDDDAMDADIHTVFETNVCKMLRKSGSENLANAKGCSFSLMESPGANDYVPVETPAASTNEQHTEVQVGMKGTLGDFSKEDIRTIEQAVVAAYNDAFSSVSFSIEDFSFLQAGSYTSSDASWWGCRYCLDDDAMEAQTAGENKLIIARATPKGSHKQNGLLQSNDLSFLHDSFEKAFCAKLQKSGQANFANVHDCSFNFVYNPVGDAKTASA